MNHQFTCEPGRDVLEVTSAGGTSGNERPASWYLEAVTGGLESSSGEKVNGASALRLCPLWQGVNVIAGDVGQCPIRLLRDEFDEVASHPAWRLLRIRPNARQTPSVFKETMQQWALIWGNAVAYIQRSGSRPTALIPLRPDCLSPQTITNDGEDFTAYHYYNPTTGTEKVFLADEVLHIQGLTSDGVWGWPLYDIGRETIGHGLALRKHGNRTFKNGVRPSGILKHPGRPKDETRERLRHEFKEVYGGVDNAGAVILLVEGLEFVETSNSNIDAQWLEALKYSPVEAASLLNLPPYKLNAMETSSVRANLEEQNSDYQQRTLSRWFNRWAEELARKLLTTQEHESGRFAFVFDFGEFLRPDIDTLSAIADRLVKAEIINRNEARRWFRLPPYQGGDVFGNPAINPKLVGDAGGEVSIIDSGQPQGEREAEDISWQVQDKVDEILASRGFPGYSNGNGSSNGEKIRS